jgi:gliding motility-associated protein GldM
MFDGGENNELRQKLINLMYLVFITLAFIYLPSEFIDTSKYLTHSFKQTELEYTAKIEEKKGLLNEQLYINTPLAQDYYNIIDISVDIDSTNTHIDRMMTTISNAVGGNNAYGYLNRSKNFILANDLVIDNGEAAILQEQLEKIKLKITGYNLKNITPFLDSLIPSEVDIKNTAGKSKNWSSFFFSKTPLAIVITNLQKIKSDLVLTKFKLVEYLAGNASSGESDKKVSILSSNSIAVEVLAAKSFLLGDKVAFRVILLDSSKGEGGSGTKNYEGVKSYIKKGGEIVKQLKIGEGGIISYTANSTGKFQLVVEDSSKTTTQNFTVTNLRTAYTEKNSPEQMYMGIDNPIQIQASEIDLKSIETEIDFGEVIPFGGKYYLRFPKEGLARLKVYSTNKDGRYLVVQKTYNVVKLPNPVVSIDGKAGGSISLKILQVQDKLSTSSTLVENEGVYNILSYEMIRVHRRGKESVINRGDVFSYDARKLLKETNSGDLIIIDNIKIKATDGTLKDVNPVVFSVK